MITNIEICYMLDFRKLPEIPASCKRIYFGHETCEKLLPTFDEIQKLLEISEKQQFELTFVIPFLTERGFEKVMFFLEQLKTVKPQIMEIVTSDWGLLHWIATNKTGTPIVSRFIVGQQLDFRLADRKSPEMVNHLSSCTLTKDRTMDMLHRLGVNRFELSNIFQPIVLADDKKYHYSLHTPFVPLTIFRSCPENADFNCLKKACNVHNCNHNQQRWSSFHYSKNDIYCLDNALYYSNPNFESQLKLNKQIDRIVYHKK